MNMEPARQKPSNGTALIMEYQRNPSNELAARLIEQYEPMVRMAAGKIARNRPDLYEDLYQTGQMALLRLFAQFDVSIGMQFEPYAMKSIIGHMKNYLRDKSWYIQVPRRIKEKGIAAQQTIDELTVRLERSPKVEEIAEAMELSVEETLEILGGRDLYHYVSLDTPISEEDSPTTFGELIGSPDNDYDQVDKRIDLQTAMAQLKPEERQVLQLVFGEDLSQRLIADRLGVSQMSISRIQRRAIDKLKRLLAGQNAAN
ncbi:sigma-70 family RNA polymerase sigma factor [Paenibacillus cisolokensis]|jgi:RNA polymerase sigma-B factor|uniref:RNA polymerase sigma factor SigB n=1 Tax=Paenibacillus cisolokensis TaxID=1658519 RepID=A0ABQ4NF79_9BACL|nr:MULTISPECIES: sigma-70 family RNA polymerase sigma factor [Paenibacillus]ALS26518.1 subunit sigma-70 of RNA polymerase [Paenibacillus sp. 32O-W]GIQ66831.1 RNA polymerase sigma factor SigB [Paenibacillus cisolokensis]